MDTAMIMIDDIFNNILTAHAINDAIQIYNNEAINNLIHIRMTPSS